MVALASERRVNIKHLVSVGTFDMDNCCMQYNSSDVKYISEFLSLESNDPIQLFIPNLSTWSHVHRKM